MGKTLERVRQERESLKRKAFSKVTFLELMTIYINDVELESVSIQVKEGKAVRLKDYPVKNFRKILRNVLIDYGVDKNEAETVVTSYQFKSDDLSAMYGFMNEFMYMYLKTGRKYKLFDKEDVSADLQLEEQDEQIKKPTPRADGKGGKNPVRHKKHLKLKSKSTASAWNKEKLDDKGNLLEAMEVIDELLS